MNVNKKQLQLFLSSFLLFFLSFFIIKPSFAGEAYVTGCLRVVNTYKPSCRIPEIPCLDLPNDIDINIFGGKRDHIAKIEGSGFPIEKQVYIVGCISTSTGIKCTTGDTNLNQQVNQIGFSVTEDIPDYFFKAVTNPVVTQNDTVSVIVRSATPKTENHIFFGIVKVDESTYQGAAKTITYGTFGFSEDPKKCIGIRWDPKGRVFDSVSLEPLPGVEVTLLDNNKNIFSAIGLENPVITKDDGLFNFFVASGNYYLSPKKNNYQFPLNLTEVNSKYSQAYYCDPKVGSQLYNRQLPIIEENELIHCDVPLKPLGVPYQSEPKSINFGNMNLGSSTKFFGQFTHPLVFVRLSQANNLLAQTIADKFGSWEITIASDKISSQGGEVVVEAIKNPNLYLLPSSGSETSPISSSNGGLLNFLNKFFLQIFKKVYSQTASNKIIFHPILRYIEGYAYNNNGEIVPNAVVRIIVQMNNKVYYETKADDNGFFSILPSDLPIFPYYIEITDPKKPNVKNNLTTSYFIKLNKNYLEKNNINLITAEKNNQIVVTSSSDSQLKKISPTKITDNNFLIPTKTNTQLEKENQSSKNIILVVVIILILLIILVAGVIFYYIKKNKNVVNEPF
jgi:hypothetical protein